VEQTIEVSYPQLIFLAIYMLIFFFTDTSSKTVITKTKASSFPSVLRQKRSAVQTIEHSDRNNDATINETCPSCGKKEVKYYSLQLRSADEGSTNFYTCDCGHK
jgi:DNA-directed RNA polymerase I subunit RPA12